MQTLCATYYGFIGPDPQFPPHKKRRATRVWVPETNYSGIPHFTSLHALKVVGMAFTFFPISDVAQALMTHEYRKYK